MNHPTIMLHVQGHGVPPLCPQPSPSPISSFWGRLFLSCSFTHSLPQPAVGMLSVALDSSLSLCSEVRKLHSFIPLKCFYTQIVISMCPTLATYRMCPISGPVPQDLEGSLELTVANYNVPTYQSFQALPQSHLLLDVLLDDLHQI